MISYVLAMGKQHLGPHVVVGYGIKIFWPGLFITSPDHLGVNKGAETVSNLTNVPEEITQTNERRGSSVRLRSSPRISEQTRKTACYLRPEEPLP